MKYTATCWACHVMQMQTLQNWKSTREMPTSSVSRSFFQHSFSVPYVCTLSVPSSLLSLASLSSPLLSLSRSLLATVRALGSAARAGDSAGVAAAAKGFIQSVNNIVRVTNDKYGNNPEVINHVTALQAQAPQLIASAKEKLLNGEDAATDERLRDVIAATAVPLAALVTAAAPTNENKANATGNFCLDILCGFSRYFSIFLFFVFSACLLTFLAFTFSSYQGTIWKQPYQKRCQKRKSPRDGLCPGWSGARGNTAEQHYPQQQQPCRSTESQRGPRFFERHFGPRYKRCAKGSKWRKWGRTSTPTTATATERTQQRIRQNHAGPGWSSLCACAREKERVERPFGWSFGKFL